MRDHAVYAGGALCVTGFTLPTVLVVTTGWPHLIVLAFTLSVIGFGIGMFSLGYRAGRDRTETIHHAATQQHLEEAGA